MSQHPILTWSINVFEEIDNYKLYGILNLRSEVFVVEQNCPYLDVDDKDQKAIHIQGYLGEKLVAYCRLFKPGDYFEEASIGRVLVSANYRKFGYGHELLEIAKKTMKEIWNESIITISAQLYLQRFYESHGFLAISDVYLEDDIPHLRMQFQSDNKE